LVLTGSIREFVVFGLIQTAGGWRDCFFSANRADISAWFSIKFPASLKFANFPD
jgi:hypothetical protein